MMSRLLDARALTKRYGGLLANDQATMSIKPGEIRGLIGPNGAGKTTFVNLITGVERPDAGEVKLADEPIVGLAPYRIARRGLVRSFQVASIFSNLTVSENLLVSYLASGLGRDFADGLNRANELLQISTLEPLAKEQGKELSGGQRMLLQVCAGFMIPSVKLYVLDEPFAGINPVVKDTLINLIVHENRQHGTAFLIVSHEMDVLRRLCSQVSVMIAGRVVVEGSLEEIARHEEVVGAYLGRRYS